MAEELKTIEQVVNRIIGVCDKKKISDGYHTFGELYDHRNMLFIALCKALAFGESLLPIWRAKKHSDGSSYDGLFVLGIGEKPGQQITYHVSTKYWEVCDFAYTPDRAPEYDGHTSEDVLVRLLTLINH